MDVLAGLLRDLHWNRMVVVDLPIAMGGAASVQRFDVTVIHAKRTGKSAWINHLPDVHFTSIGHLLHDVEARDAVP